MNRILHTQQTARIAYERTEGNLDMVELHDYNRCSKRVFLNAWRKERFKFLKTVNDLRLCEKAKTKN